MTGAGRGLGRLYALELARRGASVVVNDLGGSMQGHGSAPGVASRVVDEIEQEGGRAAASTWPTAEDVEAHLAELSATEPFSVPAPIVDEVLGVCSRIGVAP